MNRCIHTMAERLSCATSSHMAVSREIGGFPNKKAALGEPPWQLQSALQQQEQQPSGPRIMRDGHSASYTVLAHCSA